MKRERLKQAAMLFGVVLPALGAGASQAAGDQQLEEAVMAACLELHEQMYECREDFVDASIDMRTSQTGKKLTPEERAKRREKQLREIVERQAAPIERKRAWCQETISRLGPRGQEGVKERHGSLRSCYAKGACKDRVACIMPILGELHGADGKHPHKH